MKYPIRKTLINYEVKTYLSDEKLPKDSIDCSLGINPYGFTPTITKEIFANSFDGINGYPSYPYMDLKKTICKYLESIADIQPQQVYLDNGSISILKNLNRLLLNPGDKVLCVAPTFTSEISDMEAIGAQVDVVQLDEQEKFKISIKKIINHLTPKHSVIYLDNPNNPTGQVISVDELEELAEVAEKQNTMLIVDEAYGDFMPISNSSAKLIKNHPNVIAIKTLSKGLGLAGLRAGYAIVPEDFIPYMNKLPAEMALTEITARLAPYALNDINFLEKSKKRIAENKIRFLKSLKVLNYSTTEDTVPIVLIYTDKNILLFKLLLKHGIITESGDDFNGINSRHVRLRIPASVEELLKRIQLVENELINYI